MRHHGRRVYRMHQRGVMPPPKLGIREGTCKTYCFFVLHFVNMNSCQRLRNHIQTIPTQHLLLSDLPEMVEFWLRSFPDKVTVPSQLSIVAQLCQMRPVNSGFVVSK